MIKRTAPLAETIKKFLLRLWRDERGEAGEADDGGDPDPAAAAADPPPDPDPPAADADPPPDAPFLKVNDRTEYATAEAAIEGFGKASERIQEYSQHGTPQEIADRMLELDHIKEVAGGKIAEKPDPYAAYSPEEKSQWKAFEADDKGKAALARMGYISADQVEQRIVDTLERERQIGETRDHFAAESKERGIPITSQGIKILEQVAVSVYSQDAVAKKLWDDEDTKGFSDRVFTVLYGEAGSSPSPPGNPAPERERGADGKYIAKAASYEQTKQAANRLPKAPPTGSGVPTKSADEIKPEDWRDPKQRLVRAKKAFEERMGSSVGV